MQESIPDTVEASIKQHRRKRRWRAFWQLLLGLFLGSAAGFLIFLFLTVLDLRPPNEVLQTFDANTITYRDGRLQFLYSVKKSEPCRHWTDRWLWTYVTFNGKKLQLRMPLDSTPEQSLELGTTTYLLSLPLPDGVWDGQWYYESSTVSECGLFGWLHPIWINSGDIPVTIKGTSQNAPQPDTSSGGPVRLLAPVPMPRPPVKQRAPVERRRSDRRPHIVVTGGGAPLPHSAEILP